MVARNGDSHKRVGPGFYTLAPASVRFRAGVQVSEVLILVMTKKGLTSLLATSVKVGTMQVSPRVRSASAPPAM